VSIVTTLNRRRLALSALIVGAFAAPSVTHNWADWGRVPYAFHVAERDEAFSEAESDLIESRGITRKEYDEQIRVKCENAYKDESKSYREDPVFGINGCLHDKTWGGELSGTVRSYSVGVITALNLLSNFCFTLGVGILFGAVVGYVIPDIIYFIYSFLPNIIAAYFRWLNYPQQ
jgi:hypothetical protein